MLLNDGFAFITIVPVVALLILIPITIIERAHDTKKLISFYENYTIAA